MVCTWSNQSRYTQSFIPSIFSLSSSPYSSYTQSFSLSSIMTSSSSSIFLGCFWFPVNLGFKSWFLNYQKYFSISILLYCVINIIQSQGFQTYVVKTFLCQNCILFPSLVIPFDYFFLQSRKCFLKSSYHSCPLFPQSLDICSSFSALSQETDSLLIFPVSHTLRAFYCLRTICINISCFPHLILSLAVFHCLKTICNQGIVGGPSYLRIPVSGVTSSCLSIPVSDLPHISLARTF